MKDSNSLPMYIRLADSTMKSFPDLSDKWDHEYGVVLKGIEDIWIETGNSKYFDYIRRSIDSIYMGLMFYAQFGEEFHEEVMDDVVNQIINAAKFNQDEETGLLVQGYHEKKSEIWADPETGLSSSFWGRGLFRRRCCWGSPFTSS